SAGTDPERVLRRGRRLQSAGRAGQGAVGGLGPQPRLRRRLHQGRLGDHLRHRGSQHGTLLLHQALPGPELVVCSLGAGRAEVDPPPPRRRRPCWRSTPPRRPFRAMPAGRMVLPLPIDVPGEVCRDYPRSSRLEWLLTSGTGGFAMGTVGGANTRRYHGLLVASLHPPVNRVVTLARLEETALFPQGAGPLAVNQDPRAPYPEGHRLLRAVRWDGGPVWAWAVGRAELERRVLLVPGAQTVAVRYASTAPLRLRLEPLLAFRDFHALGRRNEAASPAFEQRDE